jgi:hypothetical protein
MLMMMMMMTLWSFQHYTGTLRQKIADADHQLL